MSSKQDRSSTALVLGATGGIGGEVARQLQAAGWQVRALSRGELPQGEQYGGITWLRGDAMNPGDVMAAAQGCGVIVHAVNPPGYRRWGELVLPMLDNTIAAARAQGATIVLPGTVYNYGPDAFPSLREDSPQHPQTAKGAIRVQLEQRSSMGRIGAMDRANHAQIVHVLGQSRKQFADPQAALAVLGELPRRAEQITGRGELYAGLGKG